MLRSVILVCACVAVLFCTAQENHYTNVMDADTAAYNILERRIAACYKRYVERHFDSLQADRSVFKITYYADTMGQGLVTIDDFFGLPEELKDSLKALALPQAERNGIALPARASYQLNFGFQRFHLQKVHYERDVLNGYVVTDNRGDELDQPHDEHVLMALRGQKEGKFDIAYLEYHIFETGDKEYAYKIVKRYNNTWKLIAVNVLGFGAITYLLLTL